MGSRQAGKGPSRCVGKRVHNSVCGQGRQRARQPRGQRQGGSSLLTWLLPAWRGHGRSLWLPLEVGRFCHVDVRVLGLDQNGPAGCVCGVPEPASPSFWEA